MRNCRRFLTHLRNHCSLFSLSILKAFVKAPKTLRDVWASRLSLWRHQIEGHYQRSFGRPICAMFAWATAIWLWKSGGKVVINIAAISLQHSSPLTWGLYVIEDSAYKARLPEGLAKLSEGRLKCWISLVYEIELCKWILRWYAKVSKTIYHPTWEINQLVNDGYGSAKENQPNTIK